MKRMTRLLGTLVAASLLLSGCAAIEADTQYQGLGLERHKGSVGSGALYMVQDDGTVVRYGGGTYYLSYAGKGGEEVFQLPGLENIVGIEVGASHALAQDREGCIWAWGSNKYNPLGFQVEKRVEKPKRFESVCNIKDFDAESYYSMALFENNTVKVWGREIPDEVQGIPFEFGDKIKKVFVGSLFFAISEDGDVYAWGSSGQYPIFSSGRREQWTPELLDIPCSVKSVDYPPGAVFVCDNGDVYVFGDNGAGALGNGELTPVRQIKKHPYLEDIEKIEGGSIRIAKTTSGKFLGWGDQIIAPIEASNQGYILKPELLYPPQGAIDFFSNTHSIFFILKDGRVAELIPEEHWFWPYKYMLEDYHFKFYTH
ncbi:hypothetical protein DES49_1536 [Halospina denitrificans]|uniref:Alpha-tubulin suppressor-like RCC1 family protein n=1 Tax=Halospina denitrificans TaxID=332522 RepID=A0A4R7JWP2_9GAMM|nr:hypothetical protein [Halospina denitrificans]TDT41449.1 hypothetical protein DES49_1536 [Halospina denitrificans]